MVLACSEKIPSNAPPLIKLQSLAFRRIVELVIVEMLLERFEQRKTDLAAGKELTQQTIGFAGSNVTLSKMTALLRDSDWAGCSPG